MHSPSHTWSAFTKGGKGIRMGDLRMCVQACVQATLSFYTRPPSAPWEMPIERGEARVDKGIPLLGKMAIIRENVTTGIKKNYQVT